ncbi:MAG: GIY-YIG nuclease family protein [Gammaproteobacteria bacterium]
MTATCYWVYILNCSNGAYYTGYTTDMARRFQEHLKGTAKCKYTRSFKPLNIASQWQVFGDKTAAMKIEKYIKSLSRDAKRQLILHPELLYEMCQCGNGVL